VPSQNYLDLIVWQKAMDLAERVYSTSSALPPDERFGLCSQMRRAAVSIPANIAEGQGRRTDGEFLNQVSVAHGSLRELETHLRLAVRLEMLDSMAVEGILESTSEVGRLVNGLAAWLERRIASRVRRQRRAEP
jgi:four helix bundle protein